MTSDERKTKDKVTREGAISEFWRPGRGTRALWHVNREAFD